MKAMDVGTQLSKYLAVNKWYLKRWGEKLGISHNPFSRLSSPHDLSIAYVYAGIYVHRSSSSLPILISGFAAISTTYNYTFFSAMYAMTK